MAIRGGTSWRNAQVSKRLWSTFRTNYHLGFTAFGGPPVHFKILREKFVVKLGWIDEQIRVPGLLWTWQHQDALLHQPDPRWVPVCLAGVSHLEVLCSTRHGHHSRACADVIVSLPGALGMYGLSVGISNIGDSLPGPVYALLSGLNASTVGIIAVAAVQLSEKAITDPLTRMIVLVAGAAGILYNALWYFPLLMFVAGVVTVVHDFRWLHPLAKGVLDLVKNPRQKSRAPENESMELPESQRDDRSDAVSREHEAPPSRNDAASTLPITENQRSEAETEPRVVPTERVLDFSWAVGLAIIVFFLITFTVVMVLRGVLPTKPLLYSFFANMYLAGTIIFGGGPVVIPLLREYVVAEGWVSPRDFLIGLAIQQSFPGPNFNFAVYLGALTAINGGYNSAAGAVLGYIGIFAPGLITVHGTMGIWSAIRGLRWVKSLLRGVNAGAVGLIYTAVYRLWQIGYIDQDFQQGTSLAQEPWWVVVTASSFVFGYSFGVNPPVVIVMGAVFGLTWYGVVTA
ncbi:chromate transporter [Verticillium dahliae VdLs.17]|uniref:Chromate transporter n=1 Tax=Verticillium dahliae (strain VdLs.17 / ATCC MYA-4575 / FGSC 10137) TaxID=498257 RepID=G2WVC7_VERDV|nr:chromate transporter [Verticillium dahliae VdLs.17]EGY20252.1 chromate transporter [Verticillium dahliae VdLs.17]KAH6663777.1 chromate transporter [Verticillium dahliae]KAH6685194.1 chromate transporter [Verticillium dahliae]